MSIEIKALAPAQRNSCPKEYSFGATFSDHMFTQEFDEGKGWHDALISPYHALTLDPSAAVFHYSQEIFEGLKAYRKPDGGINLFRPLDNIKRFNRSAERMVMPKVDEALHLDAIKSLVQLDQAWVPNEQGASLYIRPTMIATTAKLGLGASTSYCHFIITGPAGSYFSGGLTPISVYVADELRRAVKGGVGEAKTGGNYAASLYASEEVKKQGYSQVLWLDAIEGKYIEEVGAMNICFVYEGKHIYTPELSGSILPGITRDSILKIAPTLGYEITEMYLDIETVLQDIKSGKITEVFGCGTAAVISPVGKLGFKGEDFVINDNQTGPVAKALYDELTGIQYGTREDKFGWIESL
ncbi:branched chain amino acid aminotransferase [Colwellia sp. MT41]|uniref:Branched-chain-amino-acid aminotransferase n=1 Tax=Colwellia marinimaniae TaxID=1513592 RepID=A0ABQ0MZ95_9GAMM|nr:MULTISPECIES: branched-chain amino acid aminotransferase [Colwellia]ALO34799.1 branched chain amino acid aminotransferase [Colwellia sp. MT41]GAW97680.1 branched chain amino acid aminotransferase [Colwellia marinimaniae]